MPKRDPFNVTDVVRLPFTDTKSKMFHSIYTPLFVNILIVHYFRLFSFFVLPLSFPLMNDFSMFSHITTLLVCDSRSDGNDPHNCSIELKRSSKLEIRTHQFVFLFFDWVGNFHFRFIEFPNKNLISYWTFIALPIMNKINHNSVNWSIKWQMYFCVEKQRIAAKSHET